MRSSTQRTPNTQFLLGIILVVASPFISTFITEILHRLLNINVDNIFVAIFVCGILVAIRGLFVKGE